MILADAIGIQQTFQMFLYAFLTVSAIPSQVAERTKWLACDMDAIRVCSKSCDMKESSSTHKWIVIVLRNNRPNFRS